MLKLLEMLKRLWSSQSTLPDVDEQYLAEAVDACDLERRMRNLEIHDRPADAGVLVPFDAQLWLRLAPRDDSTRSETGAAALVPHGDGR
jgi:hypothetical protein